eukprot:361516-Rhodomonas_salina.3
MGRGGTWRMVELQRRRYLRRAEYVSPGTSLPRLSTTYPIAPYDIVVPHSDNEGGTADSSEERVVLRLGVPADMRGGITCAGARDRMALSVEGEEEEEGGGGGAGRGGEGGGGRGGAGGGGGGGGGRTGEVGEGGVAAVVLQRHLRHLLPSHPPLTPSPHTLPSAPAQPPRTSPHLTSPPPTLQRPQAHTPHRERTRHRGRERERGEGQSKERERERGRHHHGADTRRTQEINHRERAGQGGREGGREGGRS